MLYENSTVSTSMSLSLLAVYSFVSLSFLFVSLEMSPIVSEYFCFFVPLDYLFGEYAVHFFRPDGMHVCICMHMAITFSRV